MYWKPVVDYENLYEVSSNGEVKSIKSKKLLKQEKTCNGYLRVQLHKNGNAKKHKVHRLVAKSFILNVHNKPQVNHLNGDKNDNRIINLEWCTASENMKHAYDINIKKISDDHKESISKANSKKVLDLESGIIFKSLKEACLRKCLNYNTLKHNINKKLNCNLKYI